MFSGRASRAEYWWWILAQTIIVAAAGVLAIVGRVGVRNGAGQMVGANAVGVIAALLLVLFFLATIVPNISLTVRRLHDANFSGWFLLLSLIPSAGSLILFIFSLLPPNPAGARFDRVG